MMQGASNGWTLLGNDIHDNWMVNVHWDSWGSGLQIVANAIYNTVEWDAAISGNRAQGVRITNDGYERLALPNASNNSSGLNLLNNVIYNTRGGLLLFPDTANGTATVSGMAILDNTIADHVGDGPALLLRRAGGVSFVGNLIYPGRVEIQASTISGVHTDCTLVTDLASYVVSGAYVDTRSIVTGNPSFAGGTGAAAFQLLPGSPAIDACGSGEPTDYLGVLRPAGARYDIGAFELRP
jgi:hypothetical protein